jgi:hypothetical protein
MRKPNKGLKRQHSNEEQVQEMAAAAYDEDNQKMGPKRH